MNTSKKPFNLAPVFFGWLPLFLSTALVFQGALLSPLDMPGFILQVNDKSIHGITYFVLFFFCLNAFLRSQMLDLIRKAIKYGILYCAVVGALTEWLQGFVPSRSPDLGDWIMDMLGTLLAVTLGYGGLRLREMTRPKHELL